MGGSQIVGPDGTTMAVASEEHAQLIVATIDPELADDKVAPGLGSVVGRRRPDLYSILTQDGDSVPAASMYGAADSSQPDKPVAVALMQVSHFPNGTWTVTRATSQIAYAGDRGADLGLLPALFCFARGEVEADPAAAAIRSGDVLTTLAAATAGAGIWLAAHLVEEEGGRFYSTLYLLDRTGHIAHTYRKTHLTDAERSWATAGDQLAVVETEIGRIGLLIADEIWVPEVARVLALEGAELLIHAADWDRAEAATMAATERTEENRVHLVSTSRLDSPGGIGSQVIEVEPFRANLPIALMRYPTGHWTRYGFEEQLVVRLNLRNSHEKMMGNFLDPLAKRHPELYTILVS
jgi:predicted amidohydrolase